MTRARDSQVRDLYEGALRQPVAERAAFVVAHAGGDAELLNLVELLLARNATAPVCVATVESDEAMPGVGAEIDCYRIEALIGRGGMGVVYRAMDLRFDRPVAIKFLSDDLLDANARRRFQREAQLASALNHPHILTVHDVGEHAGRQYLVTEFVDGGTLHDRPRGPDSHHWRQCVELLLGVADGLAAAHAANILHRDIKPANILMSRSGYAKLADFGLARLADDAEPAAARDSRYTTAGMVIGTLEYLSPEQAVGHPLDQRSDIFSFGIVLYELVAGRRPFDGATGVDVLNAIVRLEPPPLREDLPQALRGIIDKALEKDPNDRYQSMRELVVDLRRLVHRKTREPAPVVAATAPAVARAQWLGWRVPAALLVAGVIAAGVWVALAPAAAPSNPLGGALFTRLTDFPGDETSAQISPDGKFVMFLSTQGSTGDIWFGQVGSGQFVNLTKGAYSPGSATTRDGGFTADGSEIWLRGPPPGSQRLRVWPLVGGAPRPFLSELAVNADWSRDGTRVAWQTNQPGDPLFVGDARGADARQVFVDLPGRHNHFPTFSPDGRWLYFVSGVVDPTTEWDLWRVASDGGTPERLTHGNGYVGYPTPLDDRTVLFVGDDADSSGPWLWALDVERKAVRRISVGLERYTSVAASGDRRRLVAAVANPSANLWSVPVLERIVDESEVQAYPVTNVRALAPRIAGNALYFLSSLGGGDGLWRVEAGQAAEIWRGSAGALREPPGVSADGRRLAVVVRRNGRQSLWLLAADGAEPRLLTDAVDVRGAPSWSPDGQWIVSGGADANGGGLFKIPVSGGDPVRLGGTGFNPVWSPDGTLIVYAGADIAGSSPLHAMTPEGEPVELPPIRVSSGGERFRFLPNGGGLIYMQGTFGTQDFWLLDVATLQTRQLTRLSKSDVMRTFDITPDGQRIVFDRLRQNSDIVLIELPAQP